MDIHGFIDFDWVGDVNNRRSTSWIIFNFCGGVIS